MATAFWACVTGVSCFPVAAVFVRAAGQVRDRAEPGRVAAPEASLRWPAGSPMIWRRETGAGVVRVFGCVRSSHVRCHPVRAVPLAAFIPSRVPGRGRGAWGGSASEVSGGANQMGALPPGAGGRIACGLAPGGGQNAWRPRARAGRGHVHVAAAGVAGGLPGALDRQRIWPSRMP